MQQAWPATRPPLATGFKVSSIALLFTNLWRYRELTWHLVVRGIRGQYKQSVIGYAWIVANPLLQLLVYSFVFSAVLKTPSQGGVPFSLFLFAGLAPWLFFANALMSATESITGGGSLVTMVYFPREVLAVAAVLTRAVDLLASVAILVGLMVYYGQPVTLTLAWVPLLLFAQVLFTAGLALPVAALNLFFHDVRFLVGVGLHLWFFLTPIMYPPEIVPERYQVLYDLNPLARFIGAYRWALLGNVSPPLESLLWAVLASAAFIAAGYYLFKKMEPAFADRI